MTPLERKAAFLAGQELDHPPLTLFHPQFAAQIMGLPYILSYKDPETLARREINMYRSFGVDEVNVMYVSLKLNSARLMHKLKDVSLFDGSVYDYDLDRQQQINHQALEMIHAEIGQEVCLNYGLAGPLTLARSVMPIEEILKGMRKKPELVHQLLGEITLVLKRMVDRFADIPNLTYFIYDPVASGDLISPKKYQEFALPYEKELVQHINQYTRDVALHICGDTSKELSLMADTGVAALSLDQVVDLAFAKEQVGDRVILMGNVDPVKVLLQGNPDQVAQAVRNCYEKAGDSPKGFILRSGCGVPYATPKANIQAFMEAGRALLS